MQKEIIIESLGYGGEGVGRLDGKVYFVENALPGEKVLADILQNKKSFARAKTREIITASPARVKPPCEYVEVCGGCQYQHMTYEEELKWKETQVREQLVRQLKISPDLVGPIVRSSNPYHYRQSVTLHEERGRTGFFGRDNESIIEIQHCALLNDGLKPVLRSNLPPKSDITFRLDEKGHAHSSADKDFFQIGISGRSIWTHSKCFFQNNLEITAKVAEELKKEIDSLAPPAFADLYSGVGTFALLCADNVGKIICLEENPYAIQALQKNFHNRENIGIWQARAEDNFKAALQKITAQKAFLFLDPPRTGAEPVVTQEIANTRGLSGIGYLSCHIGTLTRDLQTILAGGKYKISRVIPFDMFPRTKHIEILTFLEPAA